MKKVLVGSLAVAAALAVPAVAFASTYTDSGSATLANYTGQPCIGCTVHIVNNTTGQKNTTTSDQYGQWHWSGFIGGDKYSLHADASFGPCYYPSAGNQGPYIQPAYGFVWPNVGVYPYAQYPGCPVL
jgi:hypothetical protein